tara:strand:- start:158 stop:844 length:687 start_codon:yes stop_codon:yes gene_type:complete
MKDLLRIIEKSQNHFHVLMNTINEQKNGLSLEQYQGYLSMQYHLNRGVQKHFYTVASHFSLAGRKILRDFLVNFALEEESHYEIAYRDLKNLGLEPKSVTIDIKLWWAHFDIVVHKSPFQRLGACAVLENISGKSTQLVKDLMVATDFLSPRNTKFVAIHLHEELPHGDQILEVLNSIKLSESEYQDLLIGAEDGMTLYLRMLHHAIGAENTFTNPAVIPIETPSPLK